MTNYQPVATEVLALSVSLSVLLVGACGTTPEPKRLSFPPERTIDLTDDATWAQVVCERSIGVSVIADGHGVDAYDDLGGKPRKNADGSYTYSALSSSAQETER